MQPAHMGTNFGCVWINQYDRATVAGTCHHCALVGKNGEGVGAQPLEHLPAGSTANALTPEGPSCHWLMEDALRMSQHTTLPKQSAENRSVP